MADEKQIEQERREIEQAPQVELGPIMGRCGVCGQVARTLTPAHDILMGAIVNVRYKGECCARR